MSPWEPDLRMLFYSITLFPQYNFQFFYRENDVNSLIPWPHLNDFNIPKLFFGFLKPKIADAMCGEFLKSWTSFYHNMMTKQTRNSDNEPKRFGSFRNLASLITNASGVT